MGLNIYVSEMQYVTFQDFQLTHNLVPMAKEAGLYEALWCPIFFADNPEARDLLYDLEKGLAYLLEHPERCRSLEPTNGFGSYDQLVSVVHDYLVTCKLYPDARITVDK